MTDRAACDRCGDLVATSSLTALWDKKRYCRACLERGGVLELADLDRDLRALVIRYHTTARGVVGWIVLGGLLVGALWFTVVTGAVPVLLLPIALVLLHWNQVNTRLVCRDGTIRTEVPILSGHKPFTPDEIVSWRTRPLRSLQLNGHPPAIVFRRGTGFLSTTHRIDLSGPFDDLELLGATLRVIAPGKEK